MDDFSGFNGVLLQHGCTAYFLKNAMDTSSTTGMRTGSFGSREKPSGDGSKMGQTETEREKLAHRVVPSHSPHSCWARIFERRFICEYLEQTVPIGIFPRAWSTNHPSFLCLPFLSLLVYHSYEPIPLCNVDLLKLQSPWITQTCFDWTLDGWISFCWQSHSEKNMFLWFQSDQKCLPKLRFQT